MSSNSLGVRRGHEFSTQRSRAAMVRSTTVPIKAAEPASAGVSCASCSARLNCLMPQGFLMTLLYFAGALAVPLLFFYADVDYADARTPPLVIALSAIYALIVVFSGSVSSLYNIQLGFYTGIEVKVVDLALTFAQATGDQAHMVLAIVGASVVVIHLLPFFLIDHAGLLTTLATAGVVVNTAIVSYLDPAMILFVFGAAATFLITTLCVVSFGCHSPSLLRALRTAIAENKCLACEPMSLRV